MFLKVKTFWFKNSWLRKIYFKLSITKISASLTKLGFRKKLILIRNQKRPSQKILCQSNYWLKK